MSKGMSRRDFLKVSAAGALGVAAAGAVQAVGGAPVAAVAEETKATPVVPGTAGVVNRATLPVRDWNDPEVLLKVRWSGVNFYEFVLPDGKTIVMDPYFDKEAAGGHNEYNYTPTELPGGEWVNGADYIMLTHGHFDHLGELKSVLEKYPAAHVIVPEHAVPSMVMSQAVNYSGHYVSTAGAHDKFEFPGFIVETCRSNHNCSKYPKSDELDTAKYMGEDGKVDFFKLYNWIFEREIMNMKITTKEGFTILIWNSEMQPDGQGFETRPYFYRDANPDLLMYQTAGASFSYDRRNPNCQHMGEWVASIKGRATLPEHQQHFSYDELDAIADKFSDICNEQGVGTQFLTPEVAIWYGYTKDADGNVQVCLINKA